MKTYQHYSFYFWLTLIKSNSNYKGKQVHYFYALFEQFIHNQSKRFKNLLYNIAIGNGYHTIAAYQTNLHHLRQLINNQLTSKNYGYQLEEGSTGNY